MLLNNIKNGDETSEKSTSYEIIIEQNRLKMVKKHSLLFIIIASFLFLWGRDLCAIFTWCKIENDVLGTYGDFIGGVLGTAITFYSAYLLFITLKAQNAVNIETQKVNASVIETNTSVVRTNKVLISQTYLELFDNKFSSFIELYHRALNSYVDGQNNIGRKVFVKIMDDFCSTNFSNNSNYLNRVKAAVKEFEQLYAVNCREMSVHLRMLYLVARLVGMTKKKDDDGNLILSEEDRVLYAKCLRGQLCDEEMIMLRYNCLTNKGKNMQEFVNQFNLIKHLPLMSLLEFAKWKTKQKGDTSSVSCLNAHFIALKKFIMECCLDNNNNGTFLDSRKFKITVSFSEYNKEISLTIHNKKVKGSPGHEGEAIIDKALNKYSPNELEDMYKDFMKEILLVSNFYLYNGKDGSIINSSLSNDKKTINCIARKENPWILMTGQLGNS